MQGEDRSDAATATMAAAGAGPFPRIVRNPRILDGEPTVKGTRVPVWAIVALFRIYPDITYLCREAYPMLEPADIEEALAFYEANREEIDGLIAENESDDD